MKRRNLFVTLFTVILAICMLSQTMVFAAWEPYYGQQQATGYAVRVTKNWNSVGQLVYTAYDSYGNVILDIRAREGNIWNQTTQVLCTSTNKGPEFIGISQELDVYGLTHSWNPMKYRNGFQSGEIPYVLSNVYATSFCTNSNGVVTGVNTNNGVYNFQSNNLVNGNLNGYNSDYPKVVQNGSEYYYYYNSNSSYTYKYNQYTKYLSLNGSSISKISEIAFMPGYLLAVTTSNKVHQIIIGTLQIVATYDDYFKEWIYQGNGNNGNRWVIGYNGRYNDVHYFNTNISWNNNLNNGWDNSWNNNCDNTWNGEWNINQYGYPRIVQDGTKYIYYPSSNWSYTYKLSSAGKLSYDGTTIASDVEQVEFSQGYLVFVDEDLNVYKVRVGDTYATRVCYDFRDFYYDDAGFVYKVVTHNGVYDV